jgi:hypothetical protein
VGEDALCLVGQAEPVPVEDHVVGEDAARSRSHAPLLAVAPSVCPAWLNAAAQDAAKAGEPSAANSSPVGRAS